MKISNEVENSKPQILKKKKLGILRLLRPYIWSIGVLMFLTIFSNILGLMLPKIISHAIDSYMRQEFIMIEAINSKIIYFKLE